MTTETHIVHWDAGRLYNAKQIFDQSAEVHLCLFEQVKRKSAIQQFYENMEKTITNFWQNDLYRNKICC